MKKKSRILITSFFLITGFAITLWAEQVGLLSTPVFTEVRVQAQVSLDSTSGLYTYSYIISNPATNTGKIELIAIDISRPLDTQILSSEGLTIPFGVKTKTVDQVLVLGGASAPMVPVGERVPSGWTGGIGAGGFAIFGSGDPLTIGTDEIIPGETQDGFETISRGLPAIRPIELTPEWVLLVHSEEDATPEMKKQARQIKKSLVFKTKTLGPTAPPLYFDPKKFLNETIRGYVNESTTLGWLIDPSLKNTLLAKLDAGNSFIDANDPTQAKAALNEFMTIIKDASATQRTTEAYGLLYFNAQYLITQLPDTTLPPPPAIPRLELTPKDATLPVGDIHTLTPTFQVEQGDSVYFPQVPVKVKVTSGPNTGLVLEAVPSGTDPMSVTYTSIKEGMDILEAQVDEVPEVPDVSAGIPGATSMPVKVTWTGGSDLFILLFIPPLLKAKGGDTITVTEITGNKGSTGAEPSITRYFLSTDPAIEPDKDVFIGERFIPPLAPEEISDGGSQEFWLPDDLPQGTYHLGACADGDQSVIELNEANNCLVNQVVIALEQSTNQPPICAQAVGLPNKLWPPNHKLVPITVQGITDPDGDPLILSITKITQDEPVNGLGDGDTSPDGFGVGTSQAQIRSERSGKGSGRMYAITFTAIDGKDGECTGIVHVGVPHDQGKGANPIDDGQNYDSTVP